MKPALGRSVAVRRRPTATTLLRRSTSRTIKWRVLLFIMVAMDLRLAMLRLIRLVQVNRIDLFWRCISLVHTFLSIFILTKLNQQAIVNEIMNTVAGTSYPTSGPN